MDVEDVVTVLIHTLVSQTHASDAIRPELTDPAFCLAAGLGASQFVLAQSQHTIAHRGANISAVLLHDAIHAGDKLFGGQRARLRRRVAALHGDGVGLACIAILGSDGNGGSP